MLTIKIVIIDNNTEEWCHISMSSALYPELLEGLGIKFELNVTP